MALIKSWSLVLLSLLAIAVTTDAVAQKEYTKWYFGEYSGLDFTYDPPSPLADGQLVTTEGSASWCDPITGKLLFYTDGVTVYTSGHRKMWNGEGLYGHESSTQSALIVPDPASSVRYYIFTVDQNGYEPEPPKGMHYSIVDMSKMSGFGEVVEKNVPVNRGVVEKLTAVRLCNGRAYWIITHERNSNAFLAYYLDERGLRRPPVRSAGLGREHGPETTDGIGYLVASPDGRMLASAIFDKDNIDNQITAELFRFDPATGTVYDYIELPMLPLAYGACFSPDNSRVYFSTVGAVEQFTLTNWDRSAIVTSQRTLSNLAQDSRALQLGPDGRIYISNATWLGVIMFPNRFGIAADLRMQSVYLGPRVTYYSLPNNIVANVVLDQCSAPIARMRKIPDEICAGTCIELFDSSTSGVNVWQWTIESGTPSTSTARDPGKVCFDAPGSYTIKLVVSNGLLSDSTMRTLTVVDCPLPEARFITVDTVCMKTPVQIMDSSLRATSWQWEFEGGTPSSATGKDVSNLTFEQPGVYTIRLIASNDQGADTAYRRIVVESCLEPEAALLHDSLVCITECIDFSDRSTGTPRSYKWYFEGGVPTYSESKDPKGICYPTVGRYSVKLVVENEYGIDSVVSHVRVSSCMKPEARLSDTEICVEACLTLADASENEPTSWEWNIEGATPSSSTSANPGVVCYAKPGTYRTRLIVSNYYGADTAFSTVVVLASILAIDPSVLLIDTIEPCIALDTAIWLRGGCNGNIVTSVASNHAAVTVDQGQLVLAEDSVVRVPVRILSRRAGAFQASLLITTTDSSYTLEVRGFTGPAAESFEIDRQSLSFNTTFCEPARGTVRITNRSCQYQDLASLWIDQPSGASRYQIVSASPSTFAPDESFDVIVEYAPELPGVDACRLMMRTGEGVEVAVPLTGTFIPPADARFRLEAGATSQIVQPGEVQTMHVILENALAGAQCPDVITLRLGYERDVISLRDAVAGNGWRVASSEEDANGLRLELHRILVKDLDAGSPLVDLTFTPFVARRDTVTVRVEEFALNPDDSLFQRCHTRGSISGSKSITLAANCGDDYLRKSLNDLIVSPIIVRPNPASVSDALVLDFESKQSASYTIHVIDVHGKTVYGTTVEALADRSISVSIPSSALSSGSYQLIVRSGDVTASTRFILR